MYVMYNIYLACVYIYQSASNKAPFWLVRPHEIWGHTTGHGDLTLDNI